MMSAQVQATNKLVRANSKAVSSKAEIIAPFQYYTEAGEIIYRFADPATGLSDASYLHMDPNGKRLAQVNAGEQEMEASGEMKQAQATEKFGSLMIEMHKAAKADHDQLFDRIELDHLRAISRADPILIGGCGRSGTTLLLSILGAHPEILAMPDEMYAFYPFPFRLSKLVSTIEESEKLSWTHWCEKTPKNVLAFSEIFEAFEGQVKLIHIVRDGSDVVTSRHPNADERYYIAPERWVTDVGAGWAHREKTLLIRYEDLVNQEQATLEVVCDYLGLPFDQRMLEFESYSNVQENKAWAGGRVSKINKLSVARWQAEEHSERVAEFMTTAGAETLMSLLDYV